jgi:hypothetical protein
MFMPEQSIAWRLLLILPLVALFLGLVYGLVFSYHRYTGLSRGKALVVLLASMIAGGLRIYYRYETLRHFINNSNEVEMTDAAVAAGLFVAFLTAFALRLWGRWIGVSATAEERLPGLPGIRAWFCASNVFVGGMIVLTAWLGYDISALLALVVVAALLAAYPLIRIESPAAAPAPVAEDLSAEREKIVSMLEAGKLTPEESAELLQALGESSRTPARPVPLSGSQRLILIGAALVALGFFLPWFVINPGKEAGRMMQQVQQQMPFPVEFSPGGANSGMPAGFPFGEGQLKTSSITMTGGDIQRGLGWITLLLAVAAAVIPYVATNLDAATSRTARLLVLGIGGLIVVYLVTQNLRFVGVGLVIALSGYALQIAGAMRERLPAAA